MSCENCNSLGYITVPMMKSNGCYDKTHMCPVCKDVKAYSKHVQSKYAKEITNKEIKQDEKIVSTSTENKVLKFRRKDK